MSPRLVGWLVVLLTGGAVLANAWFGAPKIWTTAAITFALLYHSVVFGARMLRGPYGFGPSMLGLGALLAAQSVFQTIFYYADMRLGTWTDALSLVITLVLFEAVLPAEEPRTDEQHEEEKPSWPWIIALVLPSLIATAYVIKGASHAATDLSIRTPWPLLPVGTLAACVVPAIAAWLAAWKSRSRICVAALASLAILSVTLIAPLVYTLGFGFDGFLHQASEKIILETGTLSPKPPYYIGQYVLVTWLSRLTELPVGLVDRFLVPLLAACIPWLLLPLAKRRESWTLPSLLLFLPFAAFVATTPQSLAYVVGLMAVLTAVSMGPAFPLALAALAVTIHPLAGMPLAAAACALLLRRSPLAWLFLIAGIVSVPAAFAFLNTSQASVSWDFARLFDAQTLASFFSSLSPPRNRVALWADWASMVVFLTPLLAVASAIVAAWKDVERRREWVLLLAFAAGTLAAGLVLRAAGDFAFLIDYERGNYADRLFLVAAIFLFAPAAVGAGRILAAGLHGPAMTAVALLLGLASWHGALAYAALPRHDAANVSRGWSVGIADVEAVRWIEHDANGRTYTVLANQSVSAAAVRELGFKRYADNVFFYPIPTGGPLYQLYLDAVGPNPSLETINEAARLGKSELVYVVLNEYWWDAQKTGETLSNLATAEHSIRDGKVQVFAFIIR